jgi:hypothetical protein
MHEFPLSRKPASDRLKALKELVQNRSFERATLPASFWAPGIPRGALTAISGRHGLGKSGLVARLLAENPTARAAWIEESFTLHPCALVPAGVALDRVLFIEAGSELLWTARQVLETGLFDIVLLLAGSSRLIPDPELRRLQLVAEKSSSCVLLLSEETRRSWPITLQLSPPKTHDENTLCLPLSAPDS